MRVNDNVFFIEWQNPQTKTVLIVNYIKPWEWENVVVALKEAEGYFKSIDHKAAIIHDQSQFPATQSTVGAIRDLWGKLPLPPANLQVCIIVNKNKNYLLEIAFDIVEKTFFRRNVTRFVTTLEESKQLLASLNPNPS